MTDSIRVLVVDDHPLFREGVVHCLKLATDISVVGEASSGEEALALTCHLLPEVVLLDMNMPGWDGITTTQEITAACPTTGIIIVTVSEDRDTLLQAFKAGARAYVLKGVSAHDLAEVIRTVSNGGTYVSPALAVDILMSLTARPSPDPLQDLSSRESEILELIGSGMTNRAIGAQLDLSEKTIKHYVTNILQKLQVRSRVEAALIIAQRANQKKQR